MATERVAQALCQLVERPLLWLPRHGAAMDVAQCVVRCVGVSVCKGEVQQNARRWFGERRISRSGIRPVAGMDEVSVLQMRLDEQLVVGGKRRLD